MKQIILILFCMIIVSATYFLSQANKSTNSKSIPSASPTLKSNSDPLTIDFMRQKTYPGSPIHIEARLNPGSNFNRYLVSYRSDGLNQYGLLTVPMGQKPSGGWPIILFNHGYIPPNQYSTENSYASFVNPLASAGYIVFKPDYRGNGNSEGIPVQIYVSPDYLTDSMNALTSIKQYKDANPQKIGVFAHSMGGNITLHELVISKDVKAASIMAGVIGDKSEILKWWDQRIKAKSITGNDLDTSYKIQQMIAENGTPSNNPNYWNSIDPTKYVTDIIAPVQIQAGTADTSVPPSFSSTFRDLLQNAGKTVDYREFQGANHNLSPDAANALSNTILFFNKYLK